MKKDCWTILSAFFLLSCNSAKDKKAPENESNDKGNVAVSSTGDNRIIFKADGGEVSTEGWVVQRFLWDEKTTSPWLNITSNMHKDKRTINVNLNNTIPGKYVITEGSLTTNSHGAYFPDFFKPMENYSFAGGEFNLTEVDTVNNILNGTFSGIVKNSEGKTIQISEGKLINVKIKPGVTNLSAEMEKFGN